jgi:hypothetical protein
MYRYKFIIWRKFKWRSDHTSSGFDQFKVENCRSKGDHNDSDWLTVTVSSDQNVFPSQVLLLGDNLHASDSVNQAYAGPFEIDNNELVTVTVFRGESRSLGCGRPAAAS